MYCAQNRPCRPPPPPAGPPVVKLRLQHLAAASLLASGRLGEAVQVYNSTAAAYEQLGLGPWQLGQLLMEHGDVQKQLGSAAAASSLFQRAADALDQHARSLGLEEMQVRFCDHSSLVRRSL